MKIDPKALTSMFVREAARNGGTPPSRAKKAHNATVERQQASQRRFAFGYTAPEKSDILAGRSGERKTG